MHTGLFLEGEGGGGELGTVRLKAKPKNDVHASQQENSVSLHTTSGES